MRKRIEDHIRANAPALPHTYTYTDVEERISYSYHAPRSAEPMHSEELGGMTLLEGKVELSTAYEAGGRKHTFEVVSPVHRDNRRLMLSFRSASELEEWKKAIENAIEDSEKATDDDSGIAQGKSEESEQNTGLMNRAEAMLHHRKSRASELANAAARRRSKSQRPRDDSLKLRKNSTMMESLRSLVVPSTKKATTLCRRCSEEVDLDSSLKWLVYFCAFAFAYQ